MGFKEATVAPWFVTDFHAGQARAEHPGFPARSDNLPGEDKVWSAFFTNVLRGSADGPWYDQTFSTQVDYSRTFSDGGTGLKEAPPTITATSIAGVNPALEGGGAPDGGFVPTVASPGETAGAIGIFGLSGCDTHLPKERGLLISGNTSNRNSGPFFAANIRMPVYR